MSVIATERLNRTIDELVTMYLRGLGLSSAAYGIGEPGDTFGSAQSAIDIQTELLAANDAEVQGDLLAAANSLKAGLSAKAMLALKERPFFDKLSAHVRSRASSYANLDAYLTYLNTGTSPKWQGMQDYRLRTLWQSMYGSTRYPAVENLYFEVLQGSTYTNALAKFVVSGAGAGATTDGVTIDHTSYAGGFARIYVTSITGSGVVTVTGRVYDPATKTTSTGHVWTATISATGYFYLTPTTTDGLIVDVTSITIAAGITAGTFYVEAERPPVRANTATGGGNSTITLDASASSVDDIYVGCYIQNIADKYANPKLCSDYVGSTKVATISTTWSSNPSNGSAFRIMRPQLPN